MIIWASWMGPSRTKTLAKIVALSKGVHGKHYMRSKSYGQRVDIMRKMHTNLFRFPPQAYFNDDVHQPVVVFNEPSNDTAPMR